jgi:hypothetical protein
MMTAATYRDAVGMPLFAFAFRDHRTSEARRQASAGQAPVRPSHQITRARSLPAAIDTPGGHHPHGEGGKGHGRAIPRVTVSRPTGALPRDGRRDEARARSDGDERRRGESKGGAGFKTLGRISADPRMADGARQRKTGVR